MMNYLMRDKGAYVLLLLLALLCNTLMCNMSPFREVLFCPDINCYYMEGKCVAMGMLPYVDFIDTKGPLFFFLYTVGYMISPDQTWGVYLLASLASFATFFWLYRIARFFLPVGAPSLLAVGVTSIFLFWEPIQGYGARPENFILPLLTWVLYALVGFFVRSDKGAALNTAGWAFGTSCGAVLLIKYNYVVFPLFCAGLVSLLSLYSKLGKGYLSHFVMRSLSSFVLVLVPFALYFSLTQTWGAFFDIYFVTAAECSKLISGHGIMHDLWFLYYQWRDLPCVPIVYFVSVFSCFAIGNRAVGFSSNVFILSLFLTISVLLFCVYTGLYSYYGLAIMPCSVFPAVVLAHTIRKYRTMSAFLVFISVVVSVVFNYVEPARRYRMSMEGADPRLSQNYKEIEDIIATKQNPKILYLGCLSMGFGIKAGALPACPYWFDLNYCSSDLVILGQKAVTGRQADFVITPLMKRAQDKSRRQLMLESSGYTFRKSFLDGRNAVGGFELWSKT